MPGNDLFSVTFVLLLSGITIFILSGTNGFFPKMSIPFIAMLSVLVAVFGIFSAFGKIHNIS